MRTYRLHGSGAEAVKKRYGISMIRQMVIVALAVIFSAAALTAQQLPPAGQVTTNPTLGFCALTNFNSWWVNGSPSLNGVVMPANSTQFSGATFCNFYQWGQQMFLWATSPAPPTYGGGGRIFDSPVFYDLTPPNPNDNNTRRLIPHTPGFIHSLALRATKVGPHGFPMLMSKKGQLLEVHPTTLGPNKKPLVLNQAGNKVEAAKLSVANGKLVASDKTGRQISGFKLPPMKRTGAALAVQKVVIDKKPVFVDQFGNVIDTEEGQATNDVLMAQSGSLIYYVTMVNDVWVYWHQMNPAVTPANGNTPPPNSNVSFPTTSADAQTVLQWTQTNHIPPPPDLNALAIELKTSWIDVTNLPNRGNYITMKATVPAYNTSSNTQWKPTGGTVTKTLALIGMHVIGSAQGHPEMIWASFEAFGNTPNAEYQYNNSGGSATTVPQTTAGNWLLTASNSSGPFNVSHMSIATSPCPPGICANSGFTISASDTLRMAPFGMPNGTFTNNATNGTTNISTNNVVSNTQVISANNQVLNAMPSGDVRDNYHLLGAIWTIGGVPPSGNDCVSAVLSSGSTNQVGTCMLENSTMETYAQLSPSWQSPTGFQSSCFDCHTAAATSGGITSTDVSHIYAGTYGLPMATLVKMAGKPVAKPTTVKK